MQSSYSCNGPMRPHFSEEETDEGQKSTATCPAFLSCSGGAGTSLPADSQVLPTVWPETFPCRPAAAYPSPMGMIREHSPAILGNCQISPSDSIETAPGLPRFLGAQQLRSSFGRLKKKKGGQRVQAVGVQDLGLNPSSSASWLRDLGPVTLSLLVSSSHPDCL